MFIRVIKKKKKSSAGNAVASPSGSYQYLQLVETIRTEKGPRQRLILNLGPLPLKKAQYKPFVSLLNSRLTGQISLLPMKRDSKMDELIEQTAKKLLQKQAKPYQPTLQQHFQKIDTQSFRSDSHRSIGPEYLCKYAWDQLGLNAFFEETNTSKLNQAMIQGLVFGRLIEPGSERSTVDWIENRSSLYELIRFNYTPSLMSYYRAGDQLFELKDKIESWLRNQERKLFNLNETFILYDLTNTYLEGEAKSNPKAKRGKSKEKRGDCKLLTLGLVIDSLGFSKYTKLFSGNIGECKTLPEMIRSLETDSSIKGKTVVLDAGIATCENTEWLKANRYHYIVCHRGNAPFEIPDMEDAAVIRQDETKGICIKVKRHESPQGPNDQDCYLVCHSQKRAHTENSIYELQEQRFEAMLTYYKEGLQQKHRTKKYTKILELIGRLKERYPKAAQQYEISVIPEDQVIQSTVHHIFTKTIEWQKHSSALNKPKSGQYLLRTDRFDLSDKDIWEVYVMLTRVENAFRNMKSHLGIRPNFHQLEHRADTHMFISVLAYHLLHFIEYTMRQYGDHRSWKTIRNILSTHQRYTLHYDSLENDITLLSHHLRLNADPTEAQKQIYKMFGLNPNPLGKQKVAFQKK